MAFSTASNILSVDAFLTALVAFAVANAGFTDHGTDAGGTETLFRISKTVDTVQTWYGLRNETTLIGNYSALAVAGRMMLELPTDANFTTVDKGQRYPSYMGLFDLAPTYTGYSFFTDGDSVFAILELTSGVFAHMAFGNLTKVGVWAGGAYMMANNFQQGGATVWRDLTDGSHSAATMIFSARTASSNQGGGCYVRYNTGGLDNSDFSQLGAYDNPSDGSLLAASGTIPPNHNSTRFSTGVGTLFVDMYRSMLDASPSEGTFIAPLLPVMMLRQHSIGNEGAVVPLGHVPNIASINLTQLADKDIVNTDWRVFPLCTQSGDGSTATFTSHYGVAFKEIV